MSDYSGNLDFSPTRQAKIAACEKLRDTVTGISALHKSLLDESLASSPTHRNSFSEIYRMSTQAMAMKKEEMLKTLISTLYHSSTVVYHRASERCELSSPAHTVAHVFRDVQSGSLLSQSGPENEFLIAHGVHPGDRGGALELHVATTEMQLVHDELQAQAGGLQSVRM
ncbi:hypothetical protein TNIN_355661 [Trichonephila inaurata madagascariensis]|uniref:Uncharacterized protein n=1 Tax=Trichonephila inaurata madagascariensis TaxID=2747483 RepID=A0A8X6XJW7_9ARAC|nr:hypothetical protein TNIN_355661 [Trichonephila inaurata madagascariensis]